MKNETSNTSSRLTSKGQATIPVSVRRHLGVTVGSRVDFVISDDGTVLVKAINGDIRTLKGLLPKPSKVATLADYENAISQAAAKGILK